MFFNESVFHSPTLLRAFPTNAAAYFAYEQILRFLGAEQVRLDPSEAMPNRH
jgi:hypothetical protein